MANYISKHTGQEIDKVVSNAVLFVEQSLTDAQKTQVKENIGIAEELSNLSNAMIFCGTLGTNGTVTALPTASNSISNSTVGDTYKVITAGTYEGVEAKVGDVFTCSKTLEWVLIPSGDEPFATEVQIVTWGADD